MSVSIYGICTCECSCCRNKWLTGNEVIGSCESPDTDARNGIQVLYKNSRHSYCWAQTLKPRAFKPWFELGIAQW